MQDFKALLAALKAKEWMKVGVLVTKILNNVFTEFSDSGSMPKFAVAGSDGYASMSVEQLTDHLETIVTTKDVSASSIPWSQLLPLLISILQKIMVG